MKFLIPLKSLIIQHIQSLKEKRAELFFSQENITLYKPVVEKIYLGTVYGGEPKLHITENNGVYEFDCNNADEVKRINSNMSSENSFFQHKICHIKFEKVDDGYNFYLTPHGQNGLVLGPFHFTKAD